ncbi:MAG: hypothetical protein M1815_001460 [Lichina confinis]|nr:MAG: hypothetical protein M1815_001460 [Lichina confinis]
MSSLQEAESKQNATKALHSDPSASSVPSSNPYDTLIEAAVGDPVQIQALYEAHRSTRNERQREKLLDSAFAGVVLDPILLKISDQTIDPGYVDPRHCLVFWARPPKHIRSLIVQLQQKLLAVAPRLWIMPSDGLHMTTLEITHSRTAEEVAHLVGAIRPRVNEITDYTLGHRARLIKPMLSYDDAAVALSFVPEADDLYTYHHLRRDVHALVRKTGAPVDSRQDEAGFKPDPAMMRRWVNKLEEVNRWLQLEHWSDRMDGQWINMAKTPPSARWASYEGWDWGGLKERLETLMRGINQQALIDHASLLLFQKVTISDAFSAGQYWCCFELTAEDGALFIARVRLPPHPDIIQTTDETHSIECEVTTMLFISDLNLRLRSPKLFAFEKKGSPWASLVKAPYMLIEGFYGNTLQGAHTLEKIITQWTNIQAELATISFSRIGFICEYSKISGPVLGRLSWASAEDLSPDGPFDSAKDYYVAFGEPKLRRAQELPDDGDANTQRRLRPFIFLDMNLLVDEQFNIIAVIDWEFAQSAAVSANYFPMPFPLKIAGDSEEAILADPDHLAYEDFSKQAATRDLYLRKMLRLGYGLEGNKVEEHLDKLLEDMNTSI